MSEHAGSAIARTVPYTPPPELAGMSLAQIAEAVAERKLPPVEQWSPDNVDDSHMRIAADGSWYHEGSQITRPAMVRAFAGLLNREADGSYWLVVPYQKLSIEVEDACFIATDVTEPMLRQAQRLGRERGIANLGLSQNAAESLPFADGSIDLVTSRVSAHHFRDFEKALDETLRVMKKGGSLLMADSIAPEDDAICDWMNEIELRRDFSHVANRKISKIQELLADRGFDVVENDYPRIYLRFNEWTARTKVSTEETAALRKDFLEAPNATREAFQVAPVHGDIAFSWPCWVFRAVKGLGRVG